MHDLQSTMQDLVGIVRTDSEMRQALTRLGDLNARAAKVGVAGHREYHMGWHTALDLRNLLTVSEAVARSAIERTESRGGHFRDDFASQSAEWGRVNVQTSRASDGTMTVSRLPIPEMPEELKRVASAAPSHVAQAFRPARSL
jgi:succinate dehydrogenase / fumarate reductase flavoprotein subunit